MHARTHACMLAGRHVGGVCVHMEDPQAYVYVYACARSQSHHPAWGKGGRQSLGRPHLLKSALMLWKR